MSHSTVMRGGAIVLITLLMTTLALFGVLSLVSADSDYKMAKKSADWVSTYYKLENDGRHKLNQALIMVRESGFDTLATAGWEVDGLSAHIDLKEGVQNLSVEVELSESGTLTVQCWKQWQEGFNYDSDPEDLWDIFE